MPIDALLVDFCGTFPPTVSVIILAPKGPFLGRTALFEREYRPCDSTEHEP